MAKVYIKHRWTEAVLFEFDATDEQRASGLAMRAALEKATHSGADLIGANLIGANLRGANLRDADLRDADLRGANLRGANLIGADLRGADLIGANLIGADLRGANLRGANLIGADLRGANLRDADLRDANLRGANLRGANLIGADLRGGLKLSGGRPFLQIGPIGSRADTLKAYVTDQGLRISAGCFFGTRDEFADAVEKTHNENMHGIEYRAALALIDAHALHWPADVEQPRVAEAA